MIPWESRRLMFRGSTQGERYAGCDEDAAGEGSGSADRGVSWNRSPIRRPSCLAPVCHLPRHWRRVDDIRAR